MSSQSPLLIPEQGKPSIFADFFNSSAESNLELRALIIFVSHPTSLPSGLIQAIFFPLLDKGQVKEQKIGLLIINLTLKKGHRKSTAFCCLAIRWIKQLLCCSLRISWFLNAVKLNYPHGVDIYSLALGQD